MHNIILFAVRVCYCSSISRSQTFPGPVHVRQVVSEGPLHADSCGGWCHLKRPDAYTALHKDSGPTRSALVRDDRLPFRKVIPYWIEYCPVSTPQRGQIPHKVVPRPYCRGPAFGNVRGRAWFLHDEKYRTQHEALMTWMQDQSDGSRKVVVVDIGVDFTRRR